MSRNGSGTYNLVNNTWYPPVNGVLAQSTDWKTFIEDIGSALTQSVSKDGQTPMTGNLPMGNNKVTGLAVGSALTDAVAFSQLGNYSGYTTITTSSALTLTNIGQLINIGAASLTITLPLGSAVPIGSAFTFSSTVAFTIARAGSDTINGPVGSVTTQVMYGSCSIVWNGSTWLIEAGADPHALSAPGRIRFPGGLFVQWGSSIVTLSAGSVGTISYNTSFPTSIYTVVVCNGDTTATTIMPGVNSFNTSGFVVQYPAAGAIATRTNWVAVGL